MEINFVTGKGGVGKSAIAAALALRRAKAGLRTILVELGDQSYFRDYFSLSEVNYRSTPIEINGVSLDIAQWSGQECLKEYALHILKIESLYKLFFQNAVSRALVNVAPALSELAILGKITSGPPRNVGPKMPYDAIVVDAYASGHFMALLNAPAGLAAAVRFGPMGEQVRAINSVLQDRAICNFYVVALPEELPIIEGLELANNIEKTIQHKPTFLLNRILDFNLGLAAELPKNKETQLAPFVSYLSELQIRQNSMLERLTKSGYPTQTLPWVLSSDVNQVVGNLAQGLQI